MPYHLDRIAYKSVLDELHDWKRLPSLIQAQSNLGSSVAITNEELTNRLACALRQYSRATDDDLIAELGLLNNTILVHEQINYMVSNTSYLLYLYSSMRPSYYTHQANTIKAFDAVQLDNLRAFLVSAQPFIIKWLGYDYKKMYWDPWLEKGKSLEQVRSGIAALEKESGRLEEMKHVAQEIGGNLEHLAVTLIAKNSKNTRRGANLLRQGYALIQKGREQQLEDGESKETRLKDWFWQHVARYVAEDEGPWTHSQFETWWISLGCWCRA
ncbi:MAG: hypothetical protein Q9201_007718 [Fulgogasparrea decipioides]